MKIDEVSIKFIPHAEQRYDTCGDWWIEGATLHVRADIDEGQRQAFLIGLHETVEAWLCMEENVSQEAVDAFDFAFRGDGEPGDSPSAPYRSQHRRAMLIEHLMANFMGLADYGEIR